MPGRGGGLYCPWEDLAGRPELTFVRMRLPVADALYMPDVPGIAVDDRLNRVERRCVMAHELAHIDLGHHHQVAGCGPGTSRIQRRRECEADQLAARRLLSIREMGEALAPASCRWEAADSLDVTEHLLDVRLEHLHPSERAYLRRRLSQEGDER